MNYTKNKFGRELKTILDCGYNSNKIGEWAHSIHLQQCGEINKELEEVLFDLFVLEEGPEFELSIEELNKLADKLIEEGDREELTDSLQEVKEVATILEGRWLMCPFCQESWESESKLSLVRCPNCSNLSHNPVVKTD
ncbi:MAG: hypothetical protein P0S95_03540 [Rhabdochlamydiaceae bacterium]|nr:hypothetical protein [Candidatus Amphrikana amoebophyrae]